MKIEKLYEGVITGERIAGATKSLAALGINVGDVKDEATLAEAVQQFHSVVSWALKGLEAAANKVGKGDVVQPIRDALDSVSKLRQSAAPQNVPAKADHPATGYSDDPNPQTRGSKYPHRGYYSGD